MHACSLHRLACDSIMLSIEVILHFNEVLLTELPSDVVLTLVGKCCGLVRPAGEAEGKATAKTGQAHTQQLLYY